MLSSIPVHYFALSSSLDNSDSLASLDATPAENGATDAWASVGPPPDVIGSDGRKFRRHALTVRIQQNGIGVVVSDNAMGQLVVSGFREMPQGLPNPSVEAGMEVGDILEQINGKTPANPQEAGALLRASKGATPITVLRVMN